MIALPLWVDNELAAEHRLTGRQLEILAGIAKGMTYAEIGRVLYLSEETIKTHTKLMFRKLRVNDRAAAVAVAYDIGLLRTRAARIEQAQAAGLRVVA